MMELLIKILLALILLFIYSCLKISSKYDQYEEERDDNNEIQSNKRV